MEQLELIPDTRSLFEKLCNVGYLRRGFQAVKANRGAPGIDRISIPEFEKRLEEELAHLKKDLEEWSYEPKPVRRVEIPKPGGSGVRLLGVPCVRDRVVHGRKTNSRIGSVMAGSSRFHEEPCTDPYARFCECSVRGRRVVVPPSSYSIGGEFLQPIHCRSAQFENRYTNIHHRLPFFPPFSPASLRQSRSFPRAVPARLDDSSTLLSAPTGGPPNSLLSLRKS